jgi:uncharacterized protein
MRLWLGAILASALMPAAMAQEVVKGDIPRIRIQASASSEVVPDVAHIVIAVVTERKTATEAADENARTSSKVVDEIKALGIDGRDVRTVSVTLSPRYNEERDPSGRVTKRTLVAYTARNSVLVRVRDIGRVGAIARALIDKGANVFGGINFVISDAEERMDQLRVKAIQDAARKAKMYVEAIGLKLGRVLEIEPEPGPVNGAADLARTRMAEAPVAIPVEPGVQTLSARVTVTWELVQ